MGLTGTFLRNMIERRVNMNKIGDGDHWQNSVVEVMIDLMLFTMIGFRPLC